MEIKMPYTEKQKKLFRTMAHDEKIAKDNGMTQEEARKLMEDAKKYPTAPPKDEKKKK